VTSAALGVQAKYAAELASRAAGEATMKKTEEHRSAILVRTRDLPPTHDLNFLFSQPRFIHASILPLHAPTRHLPCADLDPRLPTLSLWSSAASVMCNSTLPSATSSEQDILCCITEKSCPDKEKKLR
jgi:hypothetical protein